MTETKYSIDAFRGQLHELSGQRIRGPFILTHPIDRISLVSLVRDM